MFTGLLTIFTGGLFIFTFRLWKAGEKQRVTSERAVAIAHEANQIGQAQTRAYIAIDNVSVTEDGSKSLSLATALYGGEMQVLIYVTFRNSGSSPAFDVVIKIKSKTVGREILNKFNRDMTNAIISTSPIVLAGASFNVRVEVLVPIEDYDNMVKDICVNVILVEIKYRDVFAKEWNFSTPVISSQYGRPNFRYSPLEENPRLTSQKKRRGEALLIPVQRWYCIG